MSNFLDRLQFLKKKTGEFSDGHGDTTNESREWENSYRQRWQRKKELIWINSLKITLILLWIMIFRTFT